jgi:hypothetical protein
MYSQSLDISTELWVALLQDSSVFEEKDVDLMEALFNCKNHRAIATELAEILDVPYYGVLNLQVGALGKRIVNKLPL